jgi:hypothetical protein
LCLAKVNTQKPFFIFCLKMEVFCDIITCGLICSVPANVWKELAD